MYSFYLSLLKDSEAKGIVVLHGNVAWAAHYAILHKSGSKLRSLMNTTRCYLKQALLVRC